MNRSFDYERKHAHAYGLSEGEEQAVIYTFTVKGWPFRDLADNEAIVGLYLFRTPALYSGASQWRKARPGYGLDLEGFGTRIHRERWYAKLEDAVNDFWRMQSMLEHMTDDQANALAEACDWGMV